jgi:DNA-binding LacI/PurR family transcriptional regulator
MPTKEPERRLLELIQARIGGRLPPERALATALKIGRPALRALLCDLAMRGLIERRHGSGTYVPDPAAAPLKRVTALVDAAIRLGQDPFFAAVLEALQAAVQEAGAACEVVRVRAGDPAPAVGPALLLGEGCARALARWPERVPAVAWLVEAEAPKRALVSRVALDDEGAGADAAAHLLELGCRRLAFVGHERRTSPRERIAGARRLAASRGVPLALIESGMNYADGIAAATALPRLSGLGVIAANDWLAAGLHAGMLARGAAAPLIGFDGLAIAARLGLPSLALDLGALAHDIVAELARLGSPRPPSARTLLYRLRLTAARPA